MPTVPWNVVVANAGAEYSARDDARCDGHTCYLPLYRERRTVRGKFVWVERSLFGRYFFVKMSDRWQDLFALRHVADVFMLNDEHAPAQIRDDEIYKLRSREVNGFVDIRKKGLAFDLGQLVEAAFGPLAGVTGKYDGTGHGERECALIELLGGSRRVEFAPGVLRAA